MKLFCLQFRNELVKLFARKRTYLGFAGFLVAEVIILWMWQLPPAQRMFARTLQHPLGASVGTLAEYDQGLTMALQMVMYTFLLLGGLYLALVAGDIVAKEVEDGTIRLVLSRPISRRRLLGLKWLAVSAYTWALVLFIGLTSLLIATGFCGGLGKLAVLYGQHLRHPVFAAAYETGDGLWHYARGILVLAVVLHVVTALAFMFSSLKMKPATATIATLSVFFLDVLLKMLPFFDDYRQLFLTYHLSCWMRTFLQPVPTGDILGSLAWLLGLALVFLGVGFDRFGRRDFKS